jgi:hypothetical protein
METMIVEKDIKLLYITAKSFPAGILEAHNTLHKVVPYSPDRRYFGVSRPENGSIIYRAAVEDKNVEEAAKSNCGMLVLEKGNYICMTIKDYMKGVQAIEKAFNQLLSHPDIDPQGYCVEWYISDKDVKCMVRLKK